VVVVELVEEVEDDDEAAATVVVVAPGTVPGSRPLTNHHVKKMSPATTRGRIQRPCFGSALLTDVTIVERRENLAFIRLLAGSLG
jgi:hypothetical protein